MPGNEVGLIGLGVMGGSLARNMARHGARVVAFEQDEQKSAAFLSRHGHEGDLSVVGRAEELVAQLAPPRRLFAMVPAGQPVDAVIEAFTPLLSAGDTLADGGNSLYSDTDRRATALAERDIAYIGIGVSGGEKGALEGPSLMVGAGQEAYALWSPLLQSIAAQGDRGPCVARVGTGGAGHFVKMVHNGIEYADMQLIAESYDLLRRGMGLSLDELGDLFDEWGRSELASYLIEITAQIFRTEDTLTGHGPLLDQILDTAEQKGTGRWAIEAALSLGVPVPSLAAAVDARLMSARKGERVAAESVYGGLRPPDPSQLTPEDMRQALYVAKVCAYAQGFSLIRAGDEAHEYGTHLPELARIWTAGCIIRARILDRIRTALAVEPAPANLLVSPEFAGEIEERVPAFRRVVSAAASLGIPVPALSASLAYLEAYTTARLPASLTQAQRDLFGAHTYQRVDCPGTFHTEW